MEGVMIINLHNFSLFKGFNIQKLIFSIFIFWISFFMSSKLLTQVIEGSFEFEGRMRDYIVFLPINYENVTPCPLS